VFTAREMPLLAAAPLISHLAAKVSSACGREKNQMTHASGLSWTTFGFHPHKERTAGDLESVDRDPQHVLAGQVGRVPRLVQSLPLHRRERMEDSM
jgi:hypothetical protein